MVQTGASQAGILLGSNANIPAFRWVDKASGRVVSCSSPGDCTEIERAHSSGIGLLTDGGSRGNLLSGKSEEALLTASRVADEKRANPGYRAFLANASNATRTLVLFFWEVLLELIAAARQRRRDVQPRGHRGGSYPFLRAGMCVFVRDLVAFSVLQDMFRGVPAVYATFASYDEVAHHSGLERADTLEALRKLDQRFGMIDGARRYAPRPYEIVVLSDHGRTQGATFKQRNGYSLAELVERRCRTAGSRSSTRATQRHGDGARRGRGDRPRRQGRQHGAHRRSRRRGGRAGVRQPRPDLSDGAHAPAHARGDRGAASGADAALSSHPHVGFLLVRSAADGALAIGARGRRRLADGAVTGEDPLAGFSPNAARHLLRTDGFEHVADIMVNSFYDPVTEEGCAFKELISFHGGMGGLQTKPFLLHPVDLPVPAEPLVGAEAIHGLLRRWRLGDGYRPSDSPGESTRTSTSEASSAA